MKKKRDAISAAQAIADKELIPVYVTWGKNFQWSWWRNKGSAILNHDTTHAGPMITINPSREVVASLSEAVRLFKGGCKVVYHIADDTAMLIQIAENQYGFIYLNSTHVPVYAACCPADSIRRAMSNKSRPVYVTNLPIGLIEK